MVHFHLLSTRNDVTDMAQTRDQRKTCSSNRFGSIILIKTRDLLRRNETEIKIFQSACTFTQYTNEHVLDFKYSYKLLKWIFKQPIGIAVPVHKKASQCLEWYREASICEFLLSPEEEEHR